MYLTNILKIYLTSLKVHKEEFVNILKNVDKNVDQIFCEHVETYFLMCFHNKKLIQII